MRRPKPCCCSTRGRIRNQPTILALASAVPCFSQRRKGKPQKTKPPKMCDLRGFVFHLIRGNNSTWMFKTRVSFSTTPGSEAAGVLPLNRQELHVRRHNLQELAPLLRKQINDQCHLHHAFLRFRELLNQHGSRRELIVTRRLAKMRSQSHRATPLTAPCYDNS